MPITASPEPRADHRAWTRRCPAGRRSDGSAAAGWTAGRAGRWCRGTRDDPALAATTIRSCLRISLLTAATISGVRPGRSAASVVRFGGQQPLAELAHGQRRDRGERRAIVAVDDQPRDLVGLVGDHRLGEDRRSGTSASAICAATRSLRVSAASPASSSPERTARPGRAGSQVSGNVARRVERVGVGQGGGTPSAIGRLQSDTDVVASCFRAGPDQAVSNRPCPMNSTFAIPGAGEQAAADMRGVLVQRIHLRHVLEDTDETGARIALIADEQQAGVVLRPCRHGGQRSAVKLTPSLYE